MKPIEAKNQAKLSWLRCGRLALSGMSYRMLRSGITTAILALAVAFLVYTVVYGILAERTRSAAWDELRPTREATAWLTRLAAPDSPTAVYENLIGNAPWSQRRRQEYSAWLNDGERLAVAVTAAEQWSQVRGWQQRLTPAHAAVLLGGQPLSDWLDRLRDHPGNTAALAQNLTRLQVDPPLGSTEAFFSFVRADWLALNEIARDIAAAHQATLVRFSAADPWPLVVRFAQPSPSLERELSDAPFVMPDDTLAEITRYAAAQQTLALIQSKLDQTTDAQRIQRKIGSTELNPVLAFLATRQGASWWEHNLGEGGESETVYTAAQSSRRADRLSAISRGYKPDDTNKVLGLSIGTLWLVGLSLLVCVVGVTNALLMSVTERFSEIATMKCLGAMDGSVMRIFVIEALVQGVLGGLAGVLLGVVLSLLRGAIEFGGMLGLAAEAAGQVATAAAVSLGVGVLLATLAAVGPSWVASRLSPMEAMRVE